MAKGTDSNEFMVLSTVRTGLKREFAFAMKAQSEIDGSLGRTRGSKNRNEAPVQMTPAGKKSRKCGSSGSLKKEEDVVGAFSEEEAKSDVVDLISDDEPKVLVEESKSVFDEEPVVAETVIDEENVLVEGLKEESGVKGMEVDTETAQPSVCETKEEKGNLKEKVSLEKPMRRFTRSALKGKDEETQVLDNVVGVNDNVIRGNEVSSLMTTPIPKKLSKSSMKRFPIKLKDLLATGILEGLPVKYVRGLKVRKPGESELRGVIKDGGVLCFCDKCKGIQVVTPTVYELHANSSNKRPPEYTFLDNGKSLRDVMNACSSISLDILDETVQMILGDFTMQRSTICFNCKGSISESSKGVSKLVCNSCMDLKETQASHIQSAATCSKSVSPVVQPRSQETVVATESLITETVVPKSLNTNTVVENSSNTDTVVPNTETAIPNTGTVIPESSNTHMIPKALNTGMKQSASRGKSRGKITRKDLRLHKLVFEEDVLPDGTEVAYYSHGKKLLVGYKKGYGILCSCCNAEISASQFEAHAGWSSRRKPYLHIYTSNGVSLHELSLSLSKDPRFSAGDNDDLCSICQDGGDLLCCDGCPRAFHIDCVPLPCIPSGTWYCRYCQNNFLKESNVERNVNALAAGRIAGIDPLEEINRRCIRIVKSVAVDHGGCALCGCHDFVKLFCPRTVIICDQCEKEYHVGCLKEHNLHNLEELPAGKWFCSTSCSDIHSSLVNLVFGGENNIPDSILSLIKRKREVKGVDTGVDAKCVDTGVEEKGKDTGVIEEKWVETGVEEKGEDTGVIEKTGVEEKGEDTGVIEENGIETGVEQIVEDTSVIEEKHVGTFVEEKCVKAGVEEKGENTGGVEENGVDTDIGLDIKWRVLNWDLVANGDNKQLTDEFRQVLSKAVSIFHERFDPIVDAATGRDFIPTMLFGKSICGQEFCGMYCAVLTINEEVVSVGVFRVFGSEVAELPLVATVAEYQGQGYFQCLFSCIERLLESLNVKNLVLPAADEAKSIWTNKFGFTNIDQDKMNNYKRYYHIMIFQGTSVLEKPVCTLPSTLQETV